MSEVLPHPLLPHAPVNREGLERALQPFGQSTMLPADAYTSPDVLAWEQQHLIAGSWTCVGRLTELRDGVSQRAVSVGGVSLLMTFENGVIRAFANTCRHRGHELLAEADTATTASIMCPYHAWTYRLDGSLRGAPGFRDNELFERSIHGLVELPIVDWHGWLFVNASGNAAAFSDHIGELDAIVAPYRPEDLVLGARHTYEVHANWKLVAENYHECYHCPLIHPELCEVSVPTSGDNFDLPGAWVGGTMDFKGAATTMSLDGQSNGIAIEGAPQNSVLYVGLFPNLLISGHPDYVMTHRLLPLAPDRTWIECSWFFPNDKVDPAYAVNFWDLTNAQDWKACESVQRGLTSPHFRPGPFAPSEDAVHQWVQLIGRAYEGIAPHVRATTESVG